MGVVSMFTDISSESVAAVLPLYITAAMGMSTIAYGFIDGLYQGVSAVVRIGGGWAADRSDQPKWVAFLGYGVSALARIWLLFATGFAAVTSVVAIDRIGKGIRTAPRDALITASSQPDNLGRSFGVHRMLDTIGAAVGPLLAFVILWVLPGGYRAIFVLSLAFAIVGVLILGVIVRNGHPAREAGRRPARRFWSAKDLKLPGMPRLLVATGALGLITVGDGFIYLVLQARSSFAAEWFPLLYVGTNVVFLALAIPLGRWADRIGRGRVFIIGHCALFAVYLITTIPVGGIAITLICLALLGAFYAATDGVLSALTAQLTPPESTASGIAATQTVTAIARLIASTGFGVLWFAMGRQNAMALVAGLAVLAVIASVYLLRPMLGVLHREVELSPEFDE
ncbi:MFS transporter [Gryllotalpicola protaetiae]|uniref:MFS transporter n=2 Tax=Gryllotalpicola protaetiae TaxID=2419771 RepID=A0A387BN89_9MICO|nr:MFS transporter [Gryllotalpicola protaetiae]